MNCKTLLTLIPLTFALACKDGNDAATDSGVDTSTGSDADSDAQTDNDGDGFFAEVDDCDDSNPAVNPGAAEQCDSLDNNCDGAADEGVTQTFFADTDADSYGDVATATEACAAPEGFVTDNTDCDDAQAAVNPAAQEVCDSIDNDCDSLIDDADDSLFPNEGVLSYADTDGDGYGDPTASALTCAVPPGFTEDSSDCDDTDVAVNPAADEICDSVDNDCDGLIDLDDDGLTDGFTAYGDADLDGYGDAGDARTVCALGAGVVADKQDCDDGDDEVNPAADEVCDSIDNDCDGLIDLDDTSLTDAITAYGDADLDGYGDADDDRTVCALSAGVVANDQDCDDGDDEVNPAADEVCDSIDNDCDSLIDLNDTSLTDAITAYGDTDLDGYGDASDARKVCALSAGVVADDEDCDDDDDAVNPAATEACGDTIDNNCDGDIDEDCPTCDDLQIVQYYDSFTAGSTAMDKAKAIVGFTLSSSSSESTFTSAYDGGVWDVVVIDVPGSTLPSGVEDRVEDAIADGTIVLFSYWTLQSYPTLAATLGVTVDSSFSTPLPLSAASGSPLWTISQTLPSSIKNYTYDAGINGVVLSPIDASTSETLAIYSGDATKEAIMATFDGQVIINGHLPWDFQGTDDDADGKNDMAELYINELAWTTGCIF